MARVEIDYTDAQRALQAIARRAPRLKRDISKSLRASANEVKEKQQSEVGSGSLSSAIASVETPALTKACAIADPAPPAPISNAR